MAAGFILICTAESVFAVVLLFLMTDTLLQVIQPLINSVSAYYVNKGINGILVQPEALVPLSYAAASYLLGGWLRDTVVSVILVAGFLMVTIISATVFSMPIIKEAAEEVCAKSLQDTPSHTISLGIQRKKNPSFSLLVDISILC